jgi:hypothetical protein
MAGRVLLDFLPGHTGVIDMAIPMRLSLAAAFLLASFHAPVTTVAADEREWHEVRTEHFIVRTDARKQRAIALATDLEKYRFTIAYLSGLNTRETPSVPVTVWAYRSADDYVENTKAYGTAGFYTARPAGPVSVLSLEDGDEEWQLSGKRVLFHEYTHHILHQYSPLEYPRWYDEGFAEYMATMEFDGDHAIVGKPAMHRAPFLKRVSDWLRAFEIIESRGRYLGHIGSKRVRDPRRGKGGISMQYAQGWLMVHYLHSDSRLQRAIPGFLQAINRADVDDERAFEEAFGMDYKEFDRELMRYWDEKRFATGRVEIASKMPPIEPEYRRMQPVEAAVMKYEAAVASGQPGLFNENLSRDAFTACLEAGIRPADMRLALIELALADEDWGIAETHVDALLAGNPEDARAQAAAIRLERLRHEDELPEERAAELRKRAIKAIMADPTYVPALLEYADLTFEYELPIGDNVTHVIDSIRFLAPDLVAGKIFEARLFAHKGAHDEALAMIDEMIKWSSSTQQEVQLKDVREELERGSS